MKLADKIILLRKENGLSQEALAERMDVSRQAVSKWEGAQSVPELENILRLSEIFGVSTDYLLREDPAALPTAGGEAAASRLVSMEEAEAFLRVKWCTARRIAFAVLLCILSPAGLLLLAAGSETGRLALSEEAAAGAGLILLFLMVAAAVAVFIVCGAQTAPFAWLETEVFQTARGVSEMVAARKRQYSRQYTRSNMWGACLCILSAIPLLAGALWSGEDFLLVVMLCMTLLLVGIGVWLFITAGIRWASIQKLLQEGDYTKTSKTNRSISAVVGTVYWLVVTAGYLAYSFYTNDWEKTWIVWPVAGVVYAAVAVLCTAVRKGGRR